MLTDPETGRYHPTRTEIDRAWRENREQRTMVPVQVIAVPLPEIKTVKQGTQEIGRRVQSELDK